MRLAEQLGVVVIALACAHDARAEGSALTARASTEVAGYSDTDHVNVITPSIKGHVENPTAGWAVDGGYLVDVISAASVDIVSTASRRWEEVRQGGNLGASYKRGDWGVAAQGSLSTEPDYFSYALGGYVTRDFDERNLSLIAGYGFGHDLIGREGTPFSVYSHSFDHHVLTFGITKVLDRATTLALTADVKFQEGDSSKPYRYIPLFSAETAASVPAGASLATVNRLRLAPSLIEALPLSRNRYALTARLSHRFAHSLTRLESMAYDDAWDVKAFMANGRHLFYLAPRWSVGPHARYYVQSAANFWKLAYVGSATSVPTFRTGDRELGPLMNVTGGASARWAVGPRARIDAWTLGANFDVTYTWFFDDLYIKRRLSQLIALSLEAAW
ncbi:MAG: DUF3570 domain-containing protein [Polyangiaceae bacterium]